MWSINSERVRSLMRSWSKPSQRPQPPGASEVDGPTSLAEAQQALQRAQKDRVRVIGMRRKTEENAREGKRLLVENHLAQRIRESYQ